MRCEDSRAAYLSDEAGREHLDHLASCAECLEAADDLKSMRATLGDEALWEQASPDLEDRLVTLISGAPGTEPARRRAMWWSAAAAVVVAIVVAGLAVALRSPNPDWEVAVPGTFAAPTAEGTVKGWNEDGGTRLQFDITGLDPAPDGSVYEVWFTRGAVHISAGTFSGSGKIDMWTGISRRDYPRIWITLEPIDRHTGPSAVTVMDTGADG